MKDSFTKGNFDSVLNFIKTDILGFGQKVRYNILPLIDKCLTSMLNNMENFTKVEIDLVPTISNEEKSMSAIMLYNVPDFQATNIPDESVEKDQTAIQEYLAKSVPEGGEFTVVIDINSGDVKVTYKMGFDVNDGKQAEVKSRIEQELPKV